MLDEGDILTHMQHTHHSTRAVQALEKMERGDQVFAHMEDSQGDGLAPQIRKNTARFGQHPYAVVITCSDSRVPPMHIFGAGIGELFVIRNAGNIVGEYDLGSVEYAVEHLGCSLVVVMGHTGCGAVEAAISGGAHGHVCSIVEEIKKAIGDERDGRKAEILNVCHSLEKLSESPILSEIHSRGEVDFAGAIYNIESGEVEFLSEE